MAQMLLLNPRKRRSATKRRKTASPAQRAARAAFAAMSRKRRRNPIGGSVRRAARRVMRRRRRNPISVGLPNTRTIFAALRDAAIMGGGAIAMDVAYAQVEKLLPASFMRQANKIDIGDALKAVATVALGQMLNKPTRGMAMKMATGALAVQAHGIMRAFLPANLQALNGHAELGYVTAAPVYDGVARIDNAMNGLDAYTAPGSTPLLSEYTDSFDSPLLSEFDDSVEYVG